jgi:hypothetical protein
MAELMSTRWLRAAQSSVLALSKAPFAVNIGCWDGKSFNDPVYPLFEAGFGGVAIDWGDPPELSEHLGGFPNVELMPATFVAPHNICRVLTRARCPATPDFLKIDIDGMDGEVLEAILRGGFRPLALQVEVNPEIPPPYAFNVVANSQFRPGGQTGFFGMSLQYACDLLSPFGYSLVDLDFTSEFTHDGLFVPAELVADLPGYTTCDARQAFLEAPVVLPHILGASREAKQAWRTRADRHAVLQEIWEAMLDAGRRKHGHTRVPFTLYLSATSSGRRPEAGRRQLQS